MNACRALVAIAALVLAPTVALAQASPSPYTSAQRYDAVGRVTGTIAPDPDIDGPLHHAAVRNTYDRVGRLIRVETGELAGWQSEAVAPVNWANFTIYRTAETQYDAVGRKVRDTLRDGTGGVAGTIRSVTQYRYDPAGRLECTALRMNPAAFASLPASACTPGTAGSDGPDRITRTIYDAAGQRTQLREGVGTAEQGTEATWAYNLNGQIITIIDGNGNRAELRYDGHGRQDRWTFPSALAPAQRPVAFDDSTPATALATAGAVNAALFEAYEYDPNGNRRFLTKRDGSLIEYQYDALNRVTLKIVPDRPTGAQALTAAQTRDVHYAYDLRNLQLSARFDSQSGEGVVNTYDGFGRLSRSVFDLGGIPRQLDYRHDRNGNRTRITHADGNVFFGTAYDGANRPVQLGANDAVSLAYTNYTPYGAPALTLRIANQVATAHGYDGVLRPTVRVHYFTPGTTNAVWSYGFNAASQLSSVARDNDTFAWTNHYAVTRAYTTDGLNQYSAAGPGTFLYDLNGNLTADPKRAFVYDIENRLVSATPLPGSDAVAAALVYDPLGRLFEISSPTIGTRRFLYDGDALVAEYDGANQIAKRHVHWPGADLPMVTYQGEGLATIRQLLADHQGSIVALADASGAAVQINRYDEYGIPGVGNGGTFQYTGQMWLSELGMYYYKARIYSPTLGRFLQTDPIGYQGGINLYAYVGDDPVNRIDPAGTADLNLFGNHELPILRDAGENFDVPGYFTVTSHGSPISSTKSGTAEWPSDNAVAAMISGRNTLRQQVLLLGCRLGGDGAAHSRNLARLMGVPVIAATNQVWWDRRGDWIHARVYPRDTSHPENPDLSRPGHFVLFTPDGRQINSINGRQITGLSRDTRTGETIATTMDVSTGSRIRQEQNFNLGRGR